MKRIFTALFTALSFMAWSQDLSLSVNVADTAGNPLDGIEVVVLDSLTGAFFFGITDEDGVADFIFDNLAPGTILLAILPQCFEDEFGTYQYTGAPNEAGEIYLTFCSLPPPPPCNVWIQPEFNALGGIESLLAVGTGTPPFSFEWNTGENTESIIPTSPGVYCVTLTDADGCTSENCVDFDNGGQDSICVGWIDIMGNGSGTMLQLVANGFGIPPYSYEWSTGDTVQVIDISDDSVYCVTITDATGCEADACIDLPFDQCHVTFTCDPPGTLTALPFGFPPFTYNWNTGDTTEIIATTVGETYCVTVTDALGCEATGCYTVDSMQVDTFCFVDVFNYVEPSGLTHLEAIPFGIPPFSYEWDTGETTPTIAPNDLGTYCVTVTDASGCEAVGCGQVFTAPDTCGVWLVCDPPGTLTALAWGEQPVSYEWNTGDTTQNILTPGGQEYCVTITDANGCTSFACQYVDSTNNPIGCTVTIEQYPDSSSSGEIILLATSDLLNFGEGEFTWSTGETGSTLPISNSGTYCVTYVDSSQNCFATACIFVLIPDSTEGNDIEGLVIAQIDPFFSTGEVFLIKEDQASGDLVYVDSMTITEDMIGALGLPFYEFNDLEDGTYYVQFRPDHDDLMPTYHVSALTWDFAEPINIPNSPGEFYEIIVHPTQPHMGPGYIGGMVSGDTDFNSGSSRNSEPVPGISVFLSDATMVPITQVYTDMAGEFNFPSLPWGTYYLTIDHLNIEPKTIQVDITPQNPVIPSVLIEFDGEEFTTEVRQISEEVGFEIFPNPVRDVVTIFTEGLDGDYKLSLKSMEGRTLLERNLERSTDQIQVDLSTYNSGMYLIYLENGENVYYDKVIKLD